MVAGDFVLGESHPEGHDTPRAQAGEIITGDSSIPPLRPFSGFGLASPWAAPREAGEGRTEENLGLEGRKPPGPVGAPSMPAPAPEAAPKSGIAEAEQLKKALAPKPAPEAMRKQFLDRLFDRLRNAGDQGDAQRIAATIERVWLQSDSDTAKLLLQRATVSMQAQQYPVALSLFDKLVVVEPDWAEAWNQRATARFLAGDTDGAMADINKVIKLEPRHFGALAGMGLILQGAGLDKSALQIFNRALAIYPLEPDIRKLAEKLTLEIGGQDI